MRFSTDGALTYVSSLDEWNSDFWWVLEAAAWRHEKSVVAALGRLAPKIRWPAMHGKSRHSAIWGVLGLLLHIVGIVAAVVGLSACLQWAFGRADTAFVGIAGIAFACVGAVGIWGLFEALPTLPKDPFPLQFMGILLAIAAGASLLGAWSAPSHGVAIEGELGVVGIGGAFFVGLAQVVVGSRAAIAARAPEATLQQFIAKVPVEQQRLVHDDIVAAVNHLVERGFITAEEAVAAKAAPPGALALTVAASTSH